MDSRPVLAVIFGTRPEAIKLAPVISRLKARQDLFQTLLISTSQHRQMLDQVLGSFGIRVDVDLNLMTHNQSLAGITCRIIDKMEVALRSNHVDCLVVQGDTTSAFGAALAAFYHKIPVAHVEAGLRSGDAFSPFPEEVNRRLTSVVTTIHCAPTPLACKNLLREGVSPRHVVTTGNTVVDAVEMLLETGAFDSDLPPEVPDDACRKILVTSHRRESWGNDLENICGAIRDIVTRFADVRVIYPVHLNPNVQDTVQQSLAGVNRVHLTAPLDYLKFMSLLRRCHFILTDSGGVQEEAPSFGKPVLVLRNVTERPEASMRGLSRIVGTSRLRIVEEASRLLVDEMAYRQMSEAENPYGDGRASERIVLALSRWFNGRVPVLEIEEQFSHSSRLESAAA